MMHSRLSNSVASIKQYHLNNASRSAGIVFVYAAMAIGFALEMLE